MKNFLIAFAVFLVWSFFGLWLYTLLQPKNELAIDSIVSKENTGMETEDPSIKDNIPQQKDSISFIRTQGDSLILNTENRIPESISKTALKATTDDEILFLYPEGISINKNSPEIYVPESSKDFKYKLNSYLIEHPEMELHILSLYSATENIQSPNLGIQRGTKIKQMLVDIGIPSAKIVVKPIIKEIDFDSKGIFENSISFNFKPLDKGRLAALKNIIPEPMTIYPKYSSSGILVNQELKDLLAEVVRIVQEKPDITIEITGHTDNVGNDTDNYITGLDYARQVRWYLITKGNLDRKQVIASSKGESDPIDSNNTPRGREANRRIEVKFY
jgi:OOP family OmpA-OmpF porin